MNVIVKSEVVLLIIKENFLLYLIYMVKWIEFFDIFLNMLILVVFFEISNKFYLGNMLNDFVGVD